MGKCYLRTVVHHNENEEGHYRENDTLFVLRLRADDQVAFVAEIGNRKRKSKLTILLKKKYIYLQLMDTV